VAQGASLMSNNLIVVFAALLGLAALIGVAQRSAGPQATARPVATAIPFVFPEVETTQITLIELENRRTGQKLKLTKVPGDWLAENERGAKVNVDLTQMPPILQILATLRYNRIIGSSELENFGLADGGRFIVRFTAGATYTLHIGNDNPDQTMTYIQRGENSPVLLVNAEPVVTLEEMLASQAP
jgi:hypothetical protein